MYGRSRYGSSQRWSNRGRSNPTWTNRSDTPAKPRTRPLGDLLEEIKLSDIVESSESPKITNGRYVASYNWLDGEKPTILVPGSPPVWASTKVAKQLREDSGTYFRDNNGARYAKHPTEPAVRALFEMQPEADTSLVDLVACGSTMGNLLRYARGVERTFNFDVEVVGNTAFFIRRENSPKEVIEDVRGYGHTFPETYTTWDREVKGSVSHQRLLNYEFGGLDCLVRFESDGYLREKISSEKQAPKETKDAGEANDRGTLPSLVEATGTMKVSYSIPVVGRTLQIRAQGRPIPQQAVFDLKTRSAKRPIDMEEVLPRVWVSQTPNFVIGYHQRGYFDEIKMEDVREQVQAWEEVNKASLARLVSVIEQIIETAKDLDSKRLEICRVGCGPLQLRAQLDITSTALPADLEARWTLKKEKGVGEVTPGQAKTETLEHTIPGGKDNFHSSLIKRQQERLQASSDAEDWERETWQDGCTSSEDGEDDEEKDYTACSASGCGYCGRCGY